MHKKKQQLVVEVVVEGTPYTLYGTWVLACTRPDIF